MCVCGYVRGDQESWGCWCADRSPLTEQPHRVAQSYAALRPKSESARSLISSACKAFQNLRHPAPADSKTLYDAQGFHHQGIDKSLQVGSTYRKKPIYIYIYIYIYLYTYICLHIYIYIDWRSQTPARRNKGLNPCRAEALHVPVLPNHLHWEFLGFGLGLGFRLRV